jgi:threonine synthase
MRYVSTRGATAPLSFSDVLIAGLARDGGLYMPEKWPEFTRSEIAAFAGKPFHQVASKILLAFVGDSIPREVVDAACEAAYACFRHPAVTPLNQIGPNRFVLELFHGPTLAFKDVAMQLVARLIDYVLTERDARATILCATSGDTGGAAAEAFKGRKRSDLVILFPEGRVSEVQRRMMTTLGEPNIHALIVKGTFDDCQSLVKAMFNHHEFRDSMQLAGVNSINWGRIVAQVTYYFVAAVALGAPHRKISFAVPTGNFGDIFAGYVAKRMGLPVERLIIATNENDILVRTLETGAYEIHGVRPTTSPSMDIEVSSNFERLLFDALDRDAGTIRNLMASLVQSGRFTVPESGLKSIRAEFRAASAGQAEVGACLARTLRETGYLLDPHTATGIVAADKLGSESTAPLVVLATAHPAKFPDAIFAATGRSPSLPDRLSGLMNAAEHQLAVENDLAAVESFIRSGVAGRG